MAKHAAIPRRGRGRRRSATWSCGTGENGASNRRNRHFTDSRRSTISRPRSAPTSCFSTREAEQQGNHLAALIRWYTPAEALIMATSKNAKLLALSGLRNPYPGKLGVVEEGALADLLVVEGNPLENLDYLVGDPGRNFNLIMKDGKIYKNTLH
jgi:hypothetical protein